jgi:hypothetical protein
VVGGFSIFRNVKGLFLNNCQLSKASINALNRPAVLQQQAYTYTLSYGLGEQRIHTRLENNNNLVFEMPVSNSKISM